MSFEDKEFSLFRSQPIELYEFEMNGRVWRYTPGKRDVEFLGNTFSSHRIKRSRFKQNIDNMQDVQVQLTVARDDPIALQFRVIVPSRTMWLRVYRKDRESPDTDARLVWAGRIRGAQWEGATATLLAEPLGSLVKRGGLRLKYQKRCNHFLFTEECGVSITSHTYEGEVAAVSGRDIYSGEFAKKPDQYFRLGFVEISNAFFMVTDHIGDRITTLLIAEGVKVGDSFKAHPGCDGSLPVCFHKFQNHPMFGGFWWSPEVDPYEAGVG